FQAEDGIRAFHVTGVQTCALPICRAHGLERRSLGFARLADRLEELGVEERDFGQDRRVLELASSLDQLTGTAQGGLELARLSMRSEERRVGRRRGAGWCQGAWRER